MIILFMAGAIPHILAGLILAIIVHLIHFKLEYSLSAFIGSLLPDAIKFGLSAIVQATWNIFGIKQDAFFMTLHEISSSPANWLSLGFFIFALSVFLYHFHVIKKKTMEEYDELYVFLLIGVGLHLIMDVFIQEKGPWY